MKTADEYGDVDRRLADCLGLRTKRGACAALSTGLYALLAATGS